MGEIFSFLKKVPKFVVCHATGFPPTFYKESLRENTNFVNFEKYILNNNFISKRGGSSGYKMLELPFRKCSILSAIIFTL